MDTQQIYDSNPLLKKGSIRSALSRMVRKGVIDRISKGKYELQEFLYKRYRHAKRIYDTHKKNPLHNFDLDIELDCEGVAPADLTVKEIEDVVNPKLLDRGLEILDEEGIYLYEEIIDFSVVGTEMLQDKIKEYDSSWIVNVKMTTQSNTYFFEGFMEVAESEWQ